MAKEPRKPKSELEALVSRQTACIKTQLEKIAALEGEIAILKGGLEAAGIDAVLFLRSVYNDPEAPLNLQIQAAATVAKIHAAPKINNVSFLLFDKLEESRLRRAAERAAQRIEPKMVDLTPDPAA
jgi:hypothetical protein